MRRLSRSSLALIADELQHPASWSAVRRVLRAPDVERAIAEQVSAEISRAIAAIAEARGAGLGDDEFDLDLVDGGFSGFFKKIGKKIKKAAKKVVEIHKKVAKKAIIEPHKKVIKATQKVAKKSVQITKKTASRVSAFQKRAIKKVGKAIKPYIPVILTVVGAVLAPFTGGASLAVAAALNAGYMLAMKAKQAKAAKKANRQEAAALQAEVSAQTAELNKELDTLFSQNQGVFAAAGISQAQWNAMSVEQKLAVVERINSGKMPSSQENATNAAEAQGQEPPKQTQTWQQAMQSSPIWAQWGESAGDTDAATAGVQTPTGTYDVYVEGRKVGSAQTLSEASQIMATNSKSGDRVEMFLDGRSLGLKIVTTGGGVISVPPDRVDEVRAASRQQIDGLIDSATKSVKASTESGSGSAGTWLLLAAIPAAFLFAKAKAG